MPGGKSDKGKKKEQEKANLKAKEKFATKIVEDKTFGLKNKNKSKKVQQYVSQVKKAYTGKDEQADELRRKERKQEKLENEKREKELKELYAVAVSQPKLKSGEDPKSILCAFFKAGQCARGEKCRYSHDLGLANKGSKKSLYTDTRDQGGEAEETMADWDLNTLEMAIEQNNQRINKNIVRSKTICKYFLNALENETYGWFWKCPNGDKDCIYRHALPEGFVFKTKKEREMERLLKQGTEIDKELLQLEKIEELRALLPHTGLTPVTPESFAKWKELRLQKKAAEQAQQQQQEQSKRSNQAMKDQFGMSGRDLFTYNPSLFVDDAEADDETYDITDENNIPDNPQVDPDLYGDDEIPDSDIDSSADDEDISSDNDVKPDNKLKGDLEEGEENEDGQEENAHDDPTNVNNNGQKLEVSNELTSSNSNE